MTPRILDRLCAVLLHFYPPAFRREHGREVRQFVRAAAHDGRATAAFHILFDIICAIPREWTAAVRTRELLRPGAPPSSREPMTTLIRELRYAARTLVKSPGFTAAVVLTLGLGIGANTAIFTLVDATLLRPVRVRAPERLVVWSWTSSYPDYQEYTRRTDVFEGVAAVGSAGRVNIVADGSAELVPAVFVSGNAFDVFDVDAIHGRTILPADDIFNGPLIGVLGYDYWRKRFGGNPEVVGRTFRVNGRTIAIVGVLEEGFRGTSLSGNPSLYVPTAAFSQLQTGFFGRVNALTARGFVWLSVIGRLRPDVSPDSAAATMTGVYAQLHPPSPGKQPERMKLETLRVRALGRRGTDLRTFVLLLLGAVGATLLIGCANVANLLAARAAARRHDLGVRLALGATRRRVVREVLVESLMLALAGGVAGLALASIALRLTADFQLPGGMAIDAARLHIGGGVMAATCGLSLVTGLLFGVVPAWRAAGADLLASLRHDSRTAAPAGAVRGSLLTAQIALSLVLLTGAGLFARSLKAALETDLGLESRGLVSASTSTGLARYDEGRARQFYADAVARIRALPQVEAAAWASMMPTRGSWVNQTTIEGYARQHDEDVTVNMAHVGTDYFRTLGTRIRQGREFTRGDTDAAPPVAVINEAMAGKYWAGRSAIGGRFEHHDRWLTVVGVVENVVDQELRAQPRPFAYLAFEQWLGGKGGIATDPAHLFVRARGDASTAIPLVREQLRALDPELPLYDVVPFEDRVAALVMTQRMGAVLLAVFSTVAVALATVGIYGVALYVAALRRREIGIRLALGADRRGIYALMVRQMARPIAAGIVAGAALALWSGRIATAFLHGISPKDPVTLTVVALLLLAVGLLAAFVPAWRAARVDPVTALRVD